jgi:hypothetical protein
MIRSPTTKALAGLLVLILGLAGCVSREQTTPVAPPQPATPAPTKPARTGPPHAALLLPLGGDTKAIGADMMNAAELALFDVGPNDLVLLPRDTSGSPDAAAAAARDAIGAGAEIVLGPLFGSSTRAVAPVAAAASLRVLSFSNDSSIAGGNVFILGFRPEEQVQRIVGYALGRGLARIGILAPDDAYGRLAVDAFRKAMTSVPGSAGVPAAAFYPANGSDPSSIVRSFLQTGGDQQTGIVAPSTPAPADPSTPDAAAPAPFDAILIADGGQRLHQIVALLSFYEADKAPIRLLGTRRWQEDPAMLTDPALRGAWIASIDPALESGFSSRFRSTFGHDPNALAGLAYDATALTVLISRTDRTFDVASLTDPQGFAGHLGIFRLRPDGTTEHGLAILELGPSAPTVIDPAPTTFAVGSAAR